MLIYEILVYTIIYKKIANILTYHKLFSIMLFKHALIMARMKYFTLLLYGT